MKNTFLNRVSAERRVLAVVNEVLPRDQQLAGLSLAAISKWRAVAGYKESASVVSMILVLAERCQRLSDRSNETFVEIEQVDSEKIEAGISELRIELKNWLK